MQSHKKKKSQITLRTKKMSWIPTHACRHAQPGDVQENTLNTLMCANLSCVLLLSAFYNSPSLLLCRLHLSSPAQNRRISVFGFVQAEVWQSAQRLLSRSPRKCSKGGSGNLAPFNAKCLPNCGNDCGSIAEPCDPSCILTAALLLLIFLLGFCRKSTWQRLNPSHYPSLPRYRSHYALRVAHLYTSPILIEKTTKLFCETRKNKETFSDSTPFFCMLRFFFLPHYLCFKTKVLNE